MKQIAGGPNRGDINAAARRAAENQDPKSFREERNEMKIYLRSVTLEDGPMIVRWRNDPGVSAHCLNQKPITEASNERFFHEYVETGKYQQYIVERIDEDFGVASYPIATVYLKDIDRNNRRCELCIFTSNDGEWNSASQSIAVKMLLDKAFEELGMHKVYSYAFYRYLNEADLLKKAGFRTEAVLKEEAVTAEGAHEDIVRFAITEDEWRHGAGTGRE